MNRVVVGTCLVLTLVAPTASARAQESAPGSVAPGSVALGEARAAYESADFAGTLAAVARAEEAASLSREELVELLSLRALAELATSASAPLDRTLVRLLSLDPGWTPGPSAAPRFVSAVEAARARGVPRLEVHASEVATREGTRVEAHAVDPGLLVRGYRIRWTDAEGGVPRVVDAATALLPPRARALVRAEALGPGGAVLAQSGEVVVRAHDAERAVPGEGGSGDDTLVVVLGVVGAVALVGAAVAVAVVVGTGPGSDQTMLSSPVLRW